MNTAEAIAQTRGEQKANSIADKLDELKVILLCAWFTIMVSVVVGVSMILSQMPHSK